MCLEPVRKALWSFFLGLWQKLAPCWVGRQTLCSQQPLPAKKKKKKKRKLRKNGTVYNVSQLLSALAQWFHPLNLVWQELIDVLLSICINSAFYHTQQATELWRGCSVAYCVCGSEKQSSPSVMASFAIFWNAHFTFPFYYFSFNLSSHWPINCSADTRPILMRLSAKYFRY